MPNNGLHIEEVKHINIAQKNNNTFEKFIAKYGNKTIEEVSNADKGEIPLNRKFRGPESDRYILDPKDPTGRVIDIQHVLAAAQVPGGLGQAVGLAVEVQQFFKGFQSAFLGEDLKANWLGEIFGRHYLYNPKEGATLGEKLRNFFQDYKNNDILFQPVERMMVQLENQDDQIAVLPFSLDSDSDSKQQFIGIAIDQVHQQKLQASISQGQFTMPADSTAPLPYAINTAQAQPLREWNLAQIDSSDPSLVPVTRAVIFSREVLQDRGTTKLDGSRVAKLENYTVIQNPQDGVTLYEATSPNSEPLALVNYNPNQSKLTLQNKISANSLEVFTAVNEAYEQDRQQEQIIQDQSQLSLDER